MDNVTLTIWAPATFAGNPRQQLRASCFDKASQTPSLEIYIDGVREGEKQKHNFFQFRDKKPFHR